MGLVDYHIHTYLCEHASGTPEDYINSAVNANLDEIGFSDHAPLPPGLREGITMNPEQTESYISMIEKLRAEYQDTIPVKIGFEIDFPLMDSFDTGYLTDSRIDYLIGSCHFIDDWAFDHPANIDEFKNRDIDEVYSEYFQLIKTLCDLKQINIIGHFDLVKKFGHRPKSDFTDILENISKKISENDLTVEINTAGLRKPIEEVYPSDDIMKILFKNNVPVTLGSDSHKPEEVAYMFDKAVMKLKTAGYRKISGFEKRKRYDIAI